MPAINILPKMLDSAPYGTNVQVNENPFAAGDTTLSYDGGGTIDTNDIIKIDGEKISVTTGGATPITVVRGNGGTIDAAHADNTVIHLVEKAAGTTTISYDFTVPAGKRWIIDIIEAGFGTANANNTLNIFTDAETAGVYKEIWAQQSNFTKIIADFAARYPRNIELEAGDVLRLRFVRGTSSTIVGVRIFVLESDL